MKTGTIKTLKEKGFGFITYEGAAKDLFFHMKDLEGVTFEELREGDSVTFNEESGEKGMNATHVQRA